MSIRRSVSPVLTLAVLAACSGSTPPDTTVASVRITPENPSQQVGLTVQFSAQALDASGQPINGLAVSWVSNNISIATIDTNGLVTTLSTGTAAITATIGGVSDSEVLTVNPSLCTGRVDVVLSPGQHQSYPASTCLRLPAGSPGDRYRVVVARPTLIADSLDAPTVTLQADPLLTTAAAPPSPVAQPTPARTARQGAAGVTLDGARFLAEARMRARTRAYHAEMRQREIDAGIAYRGVLPSRPALAPAQRAPAAPRLDVRLERDCTDTSTQPALLVAENADLAIYQDSVQRLAAPLSSSAANHMLQYFTDYVRDMLVDYWGPMPDVNGDGRFLVTSSPTLPEGAAAVVWSGDLSGSCAGSNQAEIMYYHNDVFESLSHPDPDSVSYFALGVLAHEAKHVTSLYNSIQRGAFLSVWVEEGTAEISQVMSSRIAWAATGGPGIGVPIDRDAILETVSQAGGTTAELWGVVGAVADMIIFLSRQPNSLVTDPVGAHEFHTFYSGSWQLHRLVGDAWGNASTPFADAPLFETMTASTSQGGVGALLQATGRTFDELYEDWVVAIATVGSGQTPTRRYTTWDLLSVTDLPFNEALLTPPGDYPWPVTGSGDNRNHSMSSAGTFSGRVGPSGLRFHDFLSAGTGAGAQVLVTGAGTSGRIIVVRLN